LYSLDLGFPPNAMEHPAAFDSARKRAMEGRLSAFVVTGFASLERNVAAPRHQGEAGN
jgi:hypothetical protein